MSMVIESVSTSPISTSISGNVVLTKPTGLSTGDLMVAVIGEYRSSTIGTPSGWTEISAVANYGMKAFYRVADSADAAASNFSFPVTGDTQGGGVLYRLTGQPSTPLVSGYQETGPGGEVNFSETLTSAASILTEDCLLIFTVWESDSTDTSSISNVAIVGGTSPTFTTRINQTFSSNEETFYIGDAIYASDTDITALNYTSTATGGNNTMLGQIASLIVVTPEKSETGTNALHEASPTTFSQAGRGDTNGTSALHEASPTIPTQSGVGYQPTVWTPTNKS